MAPHTPAPDDDDVRRRLRGLPEIAAALDAGAPVRALFVHVDAHDAEVDALVAHAARVGVVVRRVSERVLRRMGGPGEPVRAIALVGASPAASLDATMRRRGAVWLLCGPAYPGNAGLAARTAEVSGAAGVCIDAPFDAAGRKACLRASMHAERLMPVHFVAAADAVAEARAAGRRLIVVEDVGAGAPWDVDLVSPALFVVGGEVDGVPPPLVDAADACIRVPTPGFVSSYNVQAAMAIVVGEHLRQRARRVPARDA